MIDRLRWPAVWRAPVIGALIGALGWLVPSALGGGQPLTQQVLSGANSIAFVAWMFALRFLLEPLSYTAGTPGGLVAPMLVLGAQFGLLSATLCGLALPHVALPTPVFAIVGMVAFFTAVVRAPVTGIVLIAELTAGSTQLLPMLWACFPAMAIPTFLKLSRSTIY
jgi:CIC family chloride channel protein